MALRDKIRKPSFIYGLVFFLLLVFFAVLMFPYADVKLWALSAAGKKAGAEISASEISFLFPVGMELKDLKFSGKVNGKRLRSPDFKLIGFRFKLLSLFSEEKRVSFYIENGGKGEGEIGLTAGAARIIIDSEDIDISGLSYADDLDVESGEVTLKADATLSRDLLESEGAMDLAAKGLMLKGSAIFVPQLASDRLKVRLEKEGSDILIKAVNGNVEGIEIKGGGRITLRQDVVNSGINLKLTLDTSGSKNETIVPLLGMVSGGADRLSVDISGTLMRPKTLINGKKVF
ncbi:MAG: type II secretion system protein GspN [bacterium]|nr:type II secretion system protein GspN [bacterium]